MDYDLFPELDEEYQRNVQKVLDTVGDPELHEFFHAYIASKVWKGEHPLKFGEWILDRICEESVNEKSESYRQGYEAGFSTAGGDFEELVSDRPLKSRLHGLIPYTVIGLIVNGIAYFLLRLLIEVFTGEQSPWWGMLWFGLLLLFIIVNFFVWFKAVQWFVLGVDDARKAIKTAVGPTDGGDTED